MRDVDHHGAVNSLRDVWGSPRSGRGNEVAVTRDKRRTTRPPTMDAGCLIPTHLPDQLPKAIPIHSARPTAAPPAPAPDPDLLPDHSLFSALFTAPAAGSLLLRVVHAGHILELLSLSTDVAPLRFVFPAPILGAPAILAWDPAELHVLAVTTSASLYRLVIPIATARRLWKDDTGNIWIREYLIKTPASDLLGPVHVHSVHCVAIGLTHGSLLRVELDSLGSGDQQGKPPPNPASYPQAT